jgi:hypothetical protein
MIAGTYRSNAGTNFLYHGASLVSQNCREYSFRVISRERKRISVADTRCDETNKYLTCFWPIDFYFLND